MSNALPHDAYMADVAGQLTAYGLEPEQWWACEDDSGTPDSDRLDGVFQWLPGTASSEHWPHGVYLTWDQYAGWRLIEEGEGRAVHALSEDVGVFTHPRQVAADVRARFDHGLDGWSPGPICIAGGHWDPVATRDAVLAWAG
ncbi:hypothetical protein [Streptomyces sp. NPDC012888]|uniref:hypothetical protein n=1 Tax=Streptomyces sp. NPDC012888 TaxID=3364855 RepID=UPI00367F2D51